MCDISVRHVQIFTKYKQPSVMNLKFSLAKKKSDDDLQK